MKVHLLPLPPMPPPVAPPKEKHTRAEIEAETEALLERAEAARARRAAPRKIPPRRPGDQAQYSELQAIADEDAAPNPKDALDIIA
jgi:hypothetical protein